MIGLGFAQDVGWPREKSNASGTLIYHQPQLDEWKDFRRLDARMAVSVQPTGGQPRLGAKQGQNSTAAGRQPGAATRDLKSPTQLPAANSPAQRQPMTPGAGQAGQLQKLNRDA
jgi:hypothetical protein